MMVLHNAILFYAKVAKNMNFMPESVKKRQNGAENDLKTGLKPLYFVINRN